jgi:hypothetical protein
VRERVGDRALKQLAELSASNVAPLARYSSSAEFPAKNLFTSSDQDRTALTRHSILFWAMVSAHAIKSPMCAIISPGVRVVSPIRKDSKSGGAPRTALEARYANVASV